jgi:PAS domain S-box-containing protein
MNGGETMENKKRMKELSIQDALEYTESIINTVRDPLIILYEDLSVVLANRSFYQVFKVKPGETEGQHIYDLGNRQWDIPKLRELLEDILPNTTSFDGFEVKHDFPGIGKRIMLLNARRIYLEANRTKLIILTIEDITERKKIEELSEKIRKLKTRLKKNQ